jgi:hypothetical protein
MKKNKKCKIFGQTLSTDPNKIPIFIKEAIKHLEKNALKKQGLFRIPGDNKIMSKFIKNIETGRTKINFDTLEDINCVAGFIKQYFRELPEPLFLFDNYETFMDIKLLNDKDEKKEFLKKNLTLLPEGNFRLLQKLINLLHKLMINEEETKMGSSNLAMVFAPNLIKKRSSFEQKPEKELNLKEVQVMMQDMTTINIIIKTFIEEYEYFFKEEELKAQSTEKEEDEVEEIPKKITKTQRKKRRLSLSSAQRIKKTIIHSTLSRKEVKETEEVFKSRRSSLEDKNGHITVNEISKPVTF